MTRREGPTAERIDLLDALRGFALLGILLVNIGAWSGYMSLEPAERAALAGADSAWWYQFLLTAVLEGKFYTIFSFLFGLGFALQLSRLQRRGLEGVAIYRRRLLILLAIGAIHMTLLWDGDILTLYAVLGLLLPLFVSWSDRHILALAAALIVLPVAGVPLVHALSIKPDLGLSDLGNWLFVALSGDVAQEKFWRLREDIGSLLAWNLSGPPFRIGGLIESWRIPKVLAIMLLGLWAGRRLIAGQLVENRSLLRRVAIGGFVVGIPANIAYGLLGGLEQEQFSQLMQATVLYAVGVVPLGVAYAASFALLWPRAQAVLGLFAAPGRMALTNYLTHTVLGIAIFYGVGAGLFGSLNPWTICAVALAIFALQMVGSRLWLKRYGQGPMEALWRRLTYARASRHDEALAAR